MVGSIHTTVEEGQVIDRADEMGYFAFGMLIRKGREIEADTNYRWFDDRVSL